MGMKLNCWEYTNCGKQPGGHNTSLMGVCPAAMDMSCNGLNKGHNGGRICWAIPGTLCGDKVQGTFAEKKTDCMNCDFFRSVIDNEESENFTLLKPVQKYHNVYKIFRCVLQICQ